MSSFFCFICHSTVNADTNEETREKYREVVGINLSPDSHLCHICCHVLNRLWLFRSVCLKRSLEYPVLFSEKGTLNLQRNYLEFHTICVDESCEHYKSRNLNSKFYQINYFNEDFDTTEKEQEANKYVELYEDREFDDIYNQEIGVCNEKLVSEVIHDIQSVDRRFNYDDHKSASERSLNNDEICDEELNNEINDVDNIAEDLDNIQSDNDSIVNFKTDQDQSQVVVQKKKKKSKANKINRKFEKIVLSVEEQKSELESNRRIKKYIESEFKCSNCGLGFLFKDTYQTHMMRHEESNGEHRCNICTLRFANPAVLRSHKGLHSERYRCLKCDTMVRKRQRTAHARDCYGIRVDEASCHLCGKVFKDSNGLQQHLKRFHRPENSSRGYNCTLCGQRCRDQAAVRTHMIKHIQRKFHCAVCPATFSSPYTLRQHQHTHGARAAPLACGRCGGAYAGRKSLLAHVRNVHLRTGESRKRVPPARPRPRRHNNANTAVCHLCGATFKGNSKLNRHLREVCEKNRLEEELSTFYEDHGI
ncbi:unnamed protein product [Diatraea saccharalis]|uniref:C2H2-type domain-containing protein n=1 Tax=Diatraea saccharalis TaxID=40085 RepID=A0A9N9WG85_9NEOP|nr:unnamed protein product [Diatraea saccharalis]